jgi:hypothetical protein
MSHVHLRVTVGCAALLLALNAPSTPASAQGKQGAEQQVTQLAAQISALSRRVEELEKRKGAVGSPDAGSVDAARARTLEQRLASLESALASQNVEVNKSRAQTVHAPFVVVDDNGKTLFRVDVTPGNRARAVVGDPAGMHVHIGPNATGGATVAIMNNATESNAFLIGSPKDSYLNIKNEQRSVSLKADSSVGVMQIVNGSGNTVVTLRSTPTNQVGYFELGDKGGRVTVKAGTNSDLVGMVETSGPGGGGWSLGNSLKPLSVIKGWK